MNVQINNNPYPGHLPALKVIGMGGAGGNAVNRMITLGLRGVDFIVMNTDHQDLASNLAPTKIQLGPRSTRGMGAGGNPEVGRTAAEESKDAIRAALQGADMVFLTAGMGGGTGTGSIPVVGRIAKELGIVTIAVVTMPFEFEKGRRQVNAREGLAALRPNTDTLIAIPNERLLHNDQWSPKLPLTTMFQLADDVLRQAVTSISELVTEPGLINVDFSHIKDMMMRGGGALMTIGHGKGPDKADKAIHQALNHPLLETINLEQAAGVIANFTGGEDLSLPEVGKALNKIQELAGGSVDLVMGFNNDNRLEDRVQVILVVTGLGAQTLEEIIPGFEAQITPTKSLQDFIEDVPSPSPVEAGSETQQSEPVPKAEIPSWKQFQVAPEAPKSAAIDLDIPAFLRRRTAHQDKLNPQANHSH
ncbi:MAG: cell division protein FtsZ [Anaerolineales bacterium]|nr:cell division protein FtsZ [Anaerolineales bacterium]